MKNPFVREAISSVQRTEATLTGTKDEERRRNVKKEGSWPGVEGKIKKGGFGPPFFETFVFAI